MTDSGGASKQSTDEMEGLEYWGDDHHDHPYSYFWPLSHPIEPPDEDRPVKCPPLPPTTILAYNNNDEKTTMGLRKRADLLSLVDEKATNFDAPPRRQLRKRHRHALTCGDIVFTLPQKTPPPFRFPANDAAILHAFQHLDKFES